MTTDHAFRPMPQYPEVCGYSNGPLLGKCYRLEGEHQRTAYGVLLSDRPPLRHVDLVMRTGTGIEYADELPARTPQVGKAVVIETHDLHVRIAQPDERAWAYLIRAYPREDLVAVRLNLEP